MWWPVLAGVVALAHQSACGPPANCSSRSDGIDIAGGVCKADYGSRFNIDSKELMGTTCVSRNRGINKLLTSRLKQALERMKQDFQTLQDLIDQEVSISDSEPYGAAWRSGSLNVHRDYSKEQKTSMEKMSKYFNEPMQCSSGEASCDEEPQRLYTPQSALYPPRISYDNSSVKKQPEFKDNREGRLSSFRREPFSEYDPRTAYEQQRILADIRIEPDLTGESGPVSAGMKEKKYPDPESAVQGVGRDPPNFGF